MTALVGPHTGERRTAPTLTSDRDETKYFVDRSRIASLVTELTRFIAPFEHTGSSRRLPSAHHFSTTVYLDTPSRALYRAALADSANNVKIRAREYYDLHPSLAELATDPSDVVRYDPTVWFELKERTGTRSTKHRFCLRKTEVPGFFAGTATPVDAKAAGPAMHELSLFLRELREPLAASSLVNYRRASFQDPEGQLRVTVDVDLAYFAPPADLWTSTRALVRSRLDVPRGRDARGLIEVKRRGLAPAWLQDVLGSARAVEATFSKFEEAEGAVHRDA